MGDQLLGKLQTSGKVLTPSTFADVWIEAEKKMLDKIAVSQSNIDKIKVYQCHADQNDSQPAEL